MIPDKLFDYLEGRLSAAKRAALDICENRPATRLHLSSRRRNQRDNFALVSPVNAKVLRIHSDDIVFWIYFAHSDQTQVCQVWRLILVSLRKGSKLQQVIVTIE
jgi:hypothetical protein